jgi:tetratricopeptide (TPR) repeat protein
VFGLDHPDTLVSVNNLGILLKYKGDHEGAEVLWRRALEGREKALGPEHPDTLMSLNNLGTLFSDKGDYEGAEALCRRALEGLEKVLGRDHPDTLGSTCAVGSILNRLGRRAEALDLLRSYAELSEQARDYVAYNLACYECLEGNIDEAKRLIAAHLEKHSEKKDQALADPDFTAIHDWISQLPPASLSVSGSSVKPDNEIL